MTNIIVGTGWHATTHSPRNSNASKRIYQPEYLEKIWKPYIERFIEPKGYFVWQSDCEIEPWTDRSIHIVKSMNPPDGHHNRDYQASYLAGAMYAYLNECDFIYIEQDCLVYNLGEALKEAQGSLITYAKAGVQGWAETSFTYISWKYIPEFIKRCQSVDWCFWTHGQDVSPFAEAVWESLFKNDANYWTFGYGRRKPIDFTKDIFYAQQITDKELDKFLELYPSS